MINVPKLVEVEDGLYGFQYDDGSIVGKYKYAQEYDENSLTADVMTTKGDRYTLDLYGNYIKNESFWTDNIFDKPELFLYISTALFAKKEFVQNLIENTVNAFENKMKGNWVTPNPQLAKYQSDFYGERLEIFKKAVEMKFKKESTNLKDYIARLKVWSTEVSKQANKEIKD